MDRFEILSLGGCGESGRNCFLIRSGGLSFLLDCGVLRASDGSAVGGYPALTREIAESLDAVFLSHAHEDHCAALPLLYSLGYRGTVYASPETIESAPRMIRKWSDYVTQCGGALPFPPVAAGQIVFSPLSPGETEIGGIRLMTGRSGHTAGSLWFRFSLPAETLFYSGDFCLCSRTLAFDLPPRCDAAILDCAYAGRQLDQNTQYAKLLETAQCCAEGGRKLLLPLPASGRGCDVLLTLLEQTQLPLFVEESLVAGCQALLRARRWLRDGLPESLPVSARLHVIRTPEERAAACRDGGGIYLTTDGMLTTAEGRFYFEQFRSDPSVSCILTGHAAPGTPAADLLDPARRAGNRIAMQAEMLTLKVHPDDRDAAYLRQVLGAEQVILFHSPGASPN